jgi:hypothetical protein
MAALLNRARMSTATTGTGTVTLGSAVTGYASFVEAGAVNATVYSYCIEDGNDFEIGVGTYTSSGTTFSRDTVTLSKISGTSGTTKLNLSGSAEIFITAREQDLLYSGEAREALSAARTYYVRTDGSDSNTGLVDSSGGAFLTIQKALDVSGMVDLNGYDITVQVADGTYTGSIVVDIPFVGGLVYLVGNTGTPANVVISHNAYGAFTLSGAGVRLSISGVKIQNSAASSLGQGILINSQAVLDISGVIDFGTCTRYHIEANSGAFVNVLSAYTISGNASRHWAINQGAHLILSSIALTLSGTRAFTIFCFVQSGAGVTAFAFSFSGSATGQRYNASLGGTINAYSGGASYFPGDAVGATATGGQYA